MSDAFLIKEAGEYKTYGGKWVEEALSNSEGKEA